jgi:hypothetical protein
LGWREKIILLLMLKCDNPPGTPNFLWIDICQTFEIDFSSASKKSQIAMLKKEHKFKCSLTRLIKKGLIKPAVMERPDFSVQHPKGHGYNKYSLTKLGRQVAEKLQRPTPQQTQLKAHEALKNALDQLYALGHTEVMLDQVRAVIWQQQQQLSLYCFGNSRVEFDAYWNNTKLGLMLKRYTVGQVRIGVNDRQRKYGLANP